AALSAGVAARTRNLTPSVIAAWQVIRASWPAPTMPTSGAPLPAWSVTAGAHPARPPGPAPPDLRPPPRRPFPPPRPPADTTPPGGDGPMATSDKDVHLSPAPGAPVATVVREGSYGEKVVAVEPGGAEFIPLNERHGRPVYLFWTWTSPNLEFATIFVGVLGV